MSRFVEDDDLSFCLTISRDIKPDTMLDILGRVEPLPQPQTFDDFVWDTHQPGRNGLLNVFEPEDGLFVTLENNGYLGVALRTINAVRDLLGVNHYAAIYHSSGNGGYQYVEVQDGTIVANFDPMGDDAPEPLSDFFSRGEDQPAVRYALTKAIEYRMETPVMEEWLTDPTITYLIDYRTDRR